MTDRPRTKTRWWVWVVGVIAVLVVLGFVVTTLGFGGEGHTIQRNH